MKRVHESASVTSFVVTMTLLFYTAFNTYLTPRLAILPGFGFVIGILASTGFYLTFFHVLLWIYNKWIDDRVEPRQAIVGEWFYKLQIRGQEGTPRFGICEIQRHGADFHMTGIHFDPLSRKFTSRFTSDCLVRDGKNVLVFYTSVGVDEDIFTRRGTYMLSTEGVPPKRIYGVWTDVFPAKNAGDIVMQRRDKTTDAILLNYGFPLNATAFENVFGLHQPHTAAELPTSQ
jgi:hypothetical protein